MESRLITAQHYWNKAMTRRELADQEANPGAREKLLHLASLYDQLCHKTLGRTVGSLT